MIKVAVIDDEPLARARIKRLLRQHQEIEMVKEANCGQQAVQLINSLNPDIVFLDIKMPDMDGFQVMDIIKSDRHPFVVISTAFNDFAIKAFEIDAVDYLLKPYDNKRFHQSLQRALNYLNDRKNAEIGQQVRLQNLNSEQEDEPQKILVREKGFDIEITQESISYIESYGNYIKLNTNQGKYVMRSTMSNIERLLNPGDFLRIHRSFFINLNHVAEVKYLTKHEYSFELFDGEFIRSGRKYLSNIKTYLSRSI